MDEVIIKNLFLNDEAIRINKRRQEHLATLGLNISNSTVLEVGAGIGEHTGFFLDRKCKVVSTDARNENLEILKSRLVNWIPTQLDVRCLDLDYPDQNVITESFDIIYCYGTLYHLSKPLEAIRYMAEHCNKMLLIETCVSFDNEDEVNPCVEENVQTQGFHQIGCRPGRKWVFDCLKKYFEYVYMPVTQPNHPQFPINWSLRPDQSLFRSIFIASKHKLDNDLLINYVPSLQSYSC